MAVINKYEQCQMHAHLDTLFVQGHNSLYTGTLGKWQTSVFMKLMLMYVCKWNTVIAIIL